MRTKAVLGQSLGVLALACGAIVASACAHHRGLDPTATELTSDAIPLDTVFLEIENHNWSDVVVFIDHDGRVDRFADVTAAKNVTLRIPPRLQGETGAVKLLVRRIGGTDSYTSPSISVRTGSTVRFTIEDVLARSSVGVW